MASLSQGTSSDELSRTNSAIVAGGAPTPKLFRPPYGETSSTLQAAASANGLRVITLEDFTTPIVNVHNLLVFAAALLLNVSFGAFLLGWTIFVPLGFILDPLFHAIGLALLQAPALTGLWTALYNVPGVPLTNFDNSVVLGSFVSWVVLWLPIYFLSRWLVTRYRVHVYERLKKTRFFQAVGASKLYNYYTLLRPR